MRFGIFIVFALSFLLSYLGLDGISLYMARAHEQNESMQSQIILEDIKFRFKLFVNIQSSIGTIGAGHFEKGDFTKTDYGPLSNKKLFEINQEIIGFNIVDANGVIVKVFPYEQNKKALGHVSQNFNSLKISYAKGEPIWFSPPVNLLQGTQGFAFYYPITNNNKLKGWFATVVTTQLFRTEFDVREFLNSYELAIIDNLTQRPFYWTAVPNEHQKSYNSTGTYHGRKITFSIWKKNPTPVFFFPTSMKMVASFIFALLIVLFFRIYDQRKKASIQLKDISMLLKMTSKEAVARLIDLQQEIRKFGNLENVRYVTNLLEQVDLLQSTANDMKGIDKENVEILPILLTEIEENQYLIQKKEISLQFQPEKFEGLDIITNQWLFKNNVMGSIITYAIIHAQQGSALSIQFQQNFKRRVLTFHTEKIYRPDGEDHLINLDRRIEVAERILKLSNASLKIQRDDRGMIIELEF